MDCCGDKVTDEKEVTDEKNDTFMNQFTTRVCVPDVPTKATTILYVPHSVG